MKWMIAEQRSDVDPAVNRLFYHRSIRIPGSVHRRAHLVSRNNLTAALRGQVRQGGALVLRLGLFCQHRRHLSSADS